VRVILEDWKVIFEHRVHLLEQPEDILDNRNFIRTNKIILEHFRIY